MIRRALAVTVLSWGLVLGCGGDDSGGGGTATGGSGGTATGGSAGTATGGSAGTATGGSAGSGGTATGGSGGAATGGSGGTATGGSGGTATGGSGGTGGTATGGSGGTATGGSGGTGGATACNTVTQLGTAVIEAAASGTAPAAQGGTIVAGTYVLTKWEVYSGTPQNLGHQETIKVTSGKAEVVIGSSNPTRANYDFSTVGTTLTATQTCPAGGAGASFGYTAIATELKEIRTSVTKIDVVTYTKQ